MGLRLSGRQAAMLAEMGIEWPSLVGRPPRALRWVALTAAEPSADEARLLGNILRAVEACFFADTRHAALMGESRGPSPLNWLRARFDPDGEKNLGALLFGEEATARLLGRPAPIGHVLRLEHCSLVCAHTLAATAVLPRTKTELWRAICDESARLTGEM